MSFFLLTANEFTCSLIYFFFYPLNLQTHLAQKSVVRVFYPNACQHPLHLHGDLLPAVTPIDLSVGTSISKTMAQEEAESIASMGTISQPNPC